MSHTLSDADWREKTAYCLDCGTRVSFAVETAADGTSRLVCPATGRRPRRLPRVAETSVQEAIEDALRLAGCEVWHTSAFRQKGPSGVSPGIPDLLVRTTGMPQAHLIGLEVKAEDGRLSPAQETSLFLGALVTVRTPGEALQAMLDCAAECMNADEIVRIRRVMAGLRDAGQAKVNV